MHNTSEQGQEWSRAEAALDSFLSNILEIPSCFLIQMTFFKCYRQVIRIASLVSLPSAGEVSALNSLEAGLLPTKVWEGVCTRKW